MTADEVATLHAAAYREWLRVRSRRNQIELAVEFGRGVPRRFVLCELGEGSCDCERCAGDRGASLSRSFQRWRGVNRAALAELDEGSLAAIAAGIAARLTQG